MVQKPVIDTWTRPVEEIINYIQHSNGYQEDWVTQLFDNNTSLEIRRACVERLRGSSGEKIRRWFLDRIDQFTQTNQDMAVYHLMENGLYCGTISKKIISRLIAYIRKRSEWANSFRRFSLLLCKWIVRHPEDYSQEVGGYFREVLETNRPSTYSGSSEEHTAVLHQILMAIAAVGDTSFLSLLEGELDELEVGNIFKYITIHDELIAYHGTRLLVVQYLKQTKTKKRRRRSEQAAA